MPRRQTFLPARWSNHWMAAYARLSSGRQTACDAAVIALIKQETSSGLRVKPIQPDKYYREARINSGDRIVFRIEEGMIFFVDLVEHDKISRYGRRPRQQR